MITLKWKCIKCDKVFEIERCFNCNKEANGNLLYVDNNEIGGTSLICNICGYTIQNFTCDCGAINKYSIARQVSVPCDVTIYRPSNFNGALAAMKININNEPVLNLGNGEKKTIKVIPGKKLLTASLSIDSVKKELLFIEGRRYFFEISLGLFGIVIEQKDK